MGFVPHPNLRATPLIVIRKMNVNDINGNELSATASIDEIDGITGIVLESRGGTEGSPNERNIQYRPALDAILARLSKFSNTLTIYVVSKDAMKIWGNMDDRSIGEIEINGNIASARSLITSRVKNKKQNPSSKGGNSTKRILISVNISDNKLQYLITGKSCK